MDFKPYTVIYRTGGTENFKWNRVLERLSQAEAFEKKTELQAMGYKTIICKTKQLDVIGMPETFD
jgi:hypothetical protein